MTTKPMKVRTGSSGSSGRTALARKSRKRRRGKIDTAIGVVIIAVFLFPVYWMINISLQPGPDLVRIPPEWFPFDATLSAYFSHPPSIGGGSLSGGGAFYLEGSFLIHSLIIALCTAVLTLIIAVPAAFAMAQLRSRLGRPLLFSLLVAQMIPGIVMAQALFKVMNSFHLLGSFVALILADSTLAVPFAVLILRAFMVSLPSELLEAAYMDGASRLRSLVSVIVPVSRNAIITAGLFSFLFAWGDFLFGLTLSNGSNTVIPVTVGLYRFVGVNATDWNSVMATGVIASIPAAILLIVAQRYIAAGVTGGAVKG
jgi:multiple sugar transport system permease protein